MEEVIEFKVSVYANNGLPGFGAYLRPVEKGGLTDDKHIILNIAACIHAGLENNEAPKAIIIETLMHEFGHVLEDFFSEEVNEDIIEGAVESYRALSKLSRPDQDGAGDGWISVDDRLPETDVFILLHNGYHAGVGKYMPPEDNEDGRPEYASWVDETGEWINPIPTHWMPIPPIKNLTGRKRKVK